MNNLTYDTFVNWLLDNASEKMLADLCDMADEANSAATAMVERNPVDGPYFLELLADDFPYKLRDAIESKTGATITSDYDDAGVYTYYASLGDEPLSDGTMPMRFSGETPLEALAKWLRAKTA